MNLKIISLKKIKIEDGYVVWNHDAFDTALFEVCLVADKEPYSISNELHDIFLGYKQVREAKSKVNIQRTIKDITDTLPPTYQIQLFWKYLNHLEIYKIDVLINAVYRQGYGTPQKIINMLARLVRHANQSDAKCFQVSVHFACEFFIKIYPEFAEEIGVIIAKQKHQKLLSQFDRGRK